MRRRRSAAFESGGLVVRQLCGALRDDVDGPAIGREREVLGERAAQRGIARTDDRRRGGGSRASRRWGGGWGGGGVCSLRPPPLRWGPPCFERASRRRARRHRWP